MSKDVDVADADETSGKGKMPKERIDCRFFPGHAVKSCMTVIKSDGVLSEYFLLI